MTLANLIGPAVSWLDVKTWAIAGGKAWIEDYLADSERHHGLVPGHVARPNGWSTATSPRKWAEQTPPFIVVISSGLVGNDPPRQQADRSFMTAWELRYLALVHGRDEADTDLLASVYGLAVRQMVLQQAGDWVNSTGYVGPALSVETIEWTDEGYDEVAPNRRRTLVAATSTFSVVFRNVATTLGGPDQPSGQTPGADPGPFPEITSVELDTTREAIG